MIDTPLMPFLRSADLKTPSCLVPQGRMAFVMSSPVSSRVPRSAAGPSYVISCHATTMLMTSTTTSPATATPSLLANSLVFPYAARSFRYVSPSSS